jgi:hypothetical protein
MIFHLESEFKPQRVLVVVMSWAGVDARPKSRSSITVLAFVFI